MASRIFALACILLVVAGIWFQRAYMASYSEEFEAQKMNQKIASELMVVKPFSSEQFRGKILVARVKADEARYFTNGRIVLAGNVRYEDFNHEGSPRLAFDTRRAFGQLQVGSGSGSFLDSEKKLERVDVPGDVLITLADSDEIRTRKVSVNFIEGVVDTNEPVTWTGPGRSLRGQGLRFHLGTQDFRIGGRVTGEIVPAPKARRGSGTTQSKEARE